MKVFKSFGSDNYSGIHPKIMQALIDANHDSAIVYGFDDYTQQAVALCK